jgi:lipopolysaccharide export system ATP-binding protein|tara:strand:- start:690 stop:1415 length:726 start_codon:yes stop_codon:yes gene_type:complete
MIDRIEGKSLVKAYGKREVVRDVSIEVNSGEVVGLLGPNGAGKTTTFYMIVGLVPVSKGVVSFNNQDITKKAMYKRARMGIGYLPQEASVFRKLTVRENIQAIVETLGVSRSEQKNLIEKHLQELSLEHVATQRAFTLSGGERRRLEITRALITNPKFLLMDEPFSGVDPISVNEVQSIVLSLKQKGIGILITDHNVRETLKIVDRAYMLYDGKILASGDREFLVNDPQSRKFYLGEDFNM